MDEQKLPRFVDPASRKPVAGMDVCNSCRTSSGVDFFNWIFASLSHLGFRTPRAKYKDACGIPATLQDLYAAVSAQEEHRDPRLGTLAVYCSSEGVKRSFCSTCSACVFYGADKTQVVVDVAMGLLDSAQGARAEGTFLWLLGGPVQHRDDIKDGWRGDWLKAIEAESEARRSERNFPQWWRLRG